MYRSNFVGLFSFIPKAYLQYNKLFKSIQIDGYIVRREYISIPIREKRLRIPLAYIFSETFRYIENKDLALTISELQLTSPWMKPRIDEDLSVI